MYSTTNRISSSLTLHLLTTGKFPQAFNRQAIQMWEKCAATESQETAPSPIWQTFSNEAVSSVAQGHLQEWMDIPGNRLLGF
jgi:mannosyltransferase OCH1-like enzyme